MKLFQTLATAAALTLPWSAVHAAGTLQLVNEVFQEVTVAKPDGGQETRRVPAAKVAPGDEVLYVITYRNTGNEAADAVVVSNPLAAELQFKPGSAVGANSVAEVSVDGGKSWGELAKLSIAGADGKRRPAQGADVTHVRWRLQASIKPAQQGEVSFRAVLK